MPRIRLAALLLLPLLACASDKPLPESSQDASLLQGTWEILSVDRNGEPDPLQVGGSVVFAGNTVAFVYPLAAVEVRPIDPMAAALS